MSIESYHNSTTNKIPIIITIINLVVNLLESVKSNN